MEDDTLEDEQDTSDDGEDESSHDGEDYDEAFPDDNTPETSAKHAKNLREFMNEHNQHKIIARQDEKILKLKLGNLNFASQIDEAESLQILSKTIAAEEAALENQKQCRDELDIMVKRIVARMGVLRAHISKKRPGPLPEEDAGYIRDFCEACEQDIEELLASYGFVLEYLSADGEDGAEDEAEDEGEHEGEVQGEDEGGAQDQAMLAPVQPAALTFTLPFVGGKRGREVDAHEEKPAAKRGKFIEEEL